MPFSLNLSVAFDTKEHFLISYTLCSASVTPSSPLPRFLLTIPFWDPSSPFTLVLLRVPPLTDCSSHCTYSLIHSQSSNYHQELTPNQSQPRSPPSSGQLQPVLIFQEKLPHTLSLLREVEPRPSLYQEDVLYVITTLIPHR